MAHRRASHVFRSRGVTCRTRAMLQWEQPTRAAQSTLFLEQAEALWSPQTGRLSLHLLVSNPTTLQRAPGYLGTRPGPFPVQSKEVTKAQGCCLPSWLHRATAWDRRSRLSGASHKKKILSPNQHCLALLPRGLLGSTGSAVPVRWRLPVPLPVPARPGSLTQQELPAGAPGCPQPGRHPVPLAVRSGALLGTDAGTRQTGTKQQAAGPPSRVAVC